MSVEHEIIEQTSIELNPVVVDGEPDLTSATKLPLANLSAIGVAFEPLSAAFNTVINGAGGSGLYHVIVPNGMHLAAASDGSGLIGGALSNATNQLAGQARLNPVVCNPTMLFMAAALANIEKKLDAIQETQQEMLDFLIQKHKSDLKGDLLFLTDIMDGFKYNWNNRTYKRNHHVKVLDIKQEAVKSIDFAQNKIEKGISKKLLIHGDQDVKKMISKVRSDFEDYQLAVYLFSYSSFLEVMLLGNYDAQYLQGIATRIEDYSHQYRDLYTKSYNLIEKQAKTSVQSVLTGGIANASKAMGSAAAKVPLVKKSPLDELLIGAGSSLKESNTRKTTAVLQRIVDKQRSDVRPFIDNINMLNRMHNTPMEVVFDRENLYILDQAG